jgi:AcrR family transcriptional regulator
MSDKRDAILRATLQLVSENGFHGTPMSKIAEEAGVSAGIIYHYFENKEDLIDELYRELKIDLAQSMMDGYSENLPLHERFRRIWRNTIRYYIDHPRETAFMEQYANSPYMKPEAEAATVQYFKPILEFMEYARQQGVVKDMSDEMMAAFTLETAILLAKKHTNGRLLMDETAIELAVDASWDAIKR